jgi:hypothetical protein
VSRRLAAIYGGGFPTMELTTILNRCHRFLGFVNEHAPLQYRQEEHHRELIINYFHAGKLISSGVVEGLNNQAK